LVLVAGEGPDENLGTWRRHYYKIFNGGGHCNHLQSKVTINGDFTEAVALPTSVNQIKK
jgi:uncharacterized membrane protein YecN with MAPEG domain